MKTSQIELYDNRKDARDPYSWSVRIKHGDRVVKSGKHLNAADAYADAENQLIIKPGYVQMVPIKER